MKKTDWKQRLREKLVKTLLFEGIDITMSVAKALDEFIDVGVSQELKIEREGKTFKETNKYFTGGHRKVAR